MLLRKLIGQCDFVTERTRAEGFTITPQDGTTKSVISGTGENVNENNVVKFKKTGAEDITLHHRNLLNAIRKGEPLNCDHNLAFYGVVACMMGVRSFRERAYLQWDAGNEKVLKA